METPNQSPHQHDGSGAGDSTPNPSSLRKSASGRAESSSVHTQATIVSTPLAAKPRIAKVTKAKVVTPAVVSPGQTSKSSIQKSSIQTPDSLTPANPVIPAEPPIVAPAVSADDPVIIETEVDEIPTARRRWLPTAVPSWLVSLSAHVLLILLLAAITLDPVSTAMSILTASTGESQTDIQEFSVEPPDFAESELESSAAPTAPEIDSSQALTQIVAPEVSQFEATNTSALLEAIDSDSLLDKIAPSASGGAMALAQAASSLGGRSGEGKQELLQKYGGSAASEKAVAMALKWIAEHQAADGGWNFAHQSICRNRNCNHSGDMPEARLGATAMAILPFLGAGQTHMDGQYKQTVRKGLMFLIQRMEVKSGAFPTGSLWEQGGRMYSHGLAAIALCEAYAMTEDRDLAQAAQLSLNYLVYAQDPRGGGWRYKPQQPGDTSVVGWCLMALKSGRMGQLTVPPSAFKKANYFLDYVMSQRGAIYGYDKPSSRQRSATTAVGVLCRMYLGAGRTNPIVINGVKTLDKKGPEFGNLYYSYYATQVMRHFGNEPWDRWNKRMRDPLIKLQEKEGHLAGSWYTGNGGHSKAGGRLMNTALATMMLEVYYRHMPLYQEATSEETFEL